MAKGRIRAKIKRSSLYTFSNARGKPAYKKGEGEATSTGPGYSRTIYINQPLQPPNKFCTNYVSTTKYSPLTFLPVALYEQFNRVANFYFLLAAFFTMTPMSPFSPVSQILPLSMVVGFSIAKELFEDLQRLVQDTKVNSRKASVHVGNGIFESWPWRKICVGDIIRVHKDEFFPADLLLLSSSYDDGICYVETMNLDGETNLKVKRALPSLTLPSSSTSAITSDNGDDEENDGAVAFGDFSATIQCESPNPNLYTFVGNLEYDGQVYPLDPAQLLLRDSKLRNTAYVYGIVIFTGRDSKVMQNAIKSVTKRSNIEKQMDKIIYLLFTLLFLISVVSALGSTWMTVNSLHRAWYLLPQEASNSPEKQFLEGFAHLVTALILYGYLIPISLYVSIEFVKILQVKFIDNDSLLIDEESGISAKARTSNLNEQLGQVDTILSDKTGTLTCNQMDFLKCSIAGCAYGKRLSEVELAAAKQMADMELESNAGKENGNDYAPLEAVTISGSYEKTPPIKGFSFEDDRLMNGNWSNEPNADVLILFFRILAVCHTAIPELNTETGLYTYEAESPDEGAFLVAAREFGFEFFKRTQTSIFVHEKLPPSQEIVEKEYKVLHLLDFTSKRKRMSVIVQDEKGEIILFCKGADTIIFDRLADSGKMFIEDTTKHLNEYGEAGLRTLALSYRKLKEAEYTSWSEEFHKAKISIDADRDAMLEKLSDEMERELVLVGATAVEDKLQKGVPQCIDRLAQAGLKIWVLTGDKMETAINIGFSCSLLRQGMKQICVAVTAEMLAEDIKEVIKENVLMQINSAAQMIKSESDPHAAFALIIDGKTLTYALEDDMKYQFLNLAVNCASVICCRVSPKQKALVTRLVKEGTGKTTLGIGDGANDVGMIKEADLGVGISGVEGMQAVMASDFSIAQFRFLERLLVVHGHWCYKRIAKMICYFFYKNIAFGLTLFYFEAYTGFSGQSIYDNWYMLLFNVILTSLPVISLGVFEQDVSAEICLEFPTLYNQGPRNLFFDWNRIFGWLLNGFYCSLVIFLLNVAIYSNQAFREQGQTPDLNTVGTAMFTSIIWAVNFQIFLITNYFTWIQQFLIWGSITMWYLLLYIYGALPIDISYNVYHILPEMLGPAVIYWITTLLVTVTSILPHLFHISYQRCTNPEDHHVIQEMKYYRKDVTDGQMWRREQSKARQETKIGITARVEAKLMNLKGKMQRYATSQTSRAVAPTPN